VTGFDDVSADLVLVNATATEISGDGMVYQITVQPSGCGTVEVTVPADSASDVLGTGNTESNTVVVSSGMSVLPKKRSLVSC
jgi:hypothetical protein